MTEKNNGKLWKGNQDRKTTEAFSAKKAAKHPPKKLIQGNVGQQKPKTLNHMRD